MIKSDLILFQVLTTFKLVHRARLLCFRNDTQMLNGTHKSLYKFIISRLMINTIKTILIT